MAFYTRCLEELPKLQITDVHRLVESSNGKSPTSLLDKGFKLYVSSYIFNYEVSNKDKLSGEVSVRACCYRSMRRNEKPHNLRVVLKHSEPVIMTRHHCSCVAGTGLCNHIVALLLQSAHYSERGIKVVPPVHSCTDTEQQWHKPRTTGLKPGPVDQMTITKPTNTQRSEGGIRSTLYKALAGPLPDLSVLQVEETYSNFDPVSRPLVCTMGMSADKPLVDSRFGPVQVGSVLSYQQPPLKTRHIKHHEDAPLFPPLPLEDYRLDRNLEGCMFVLSEQDELHIKSLQVTFDTAQKIEEATREQSGLSEWHTLRKPRLTSSRFREACHVQGLPSAKTLAERILKGTAPTAAMKRGLDMEMEAAIEYAKMKNVNYFPCGLVIHPDVPWLASSPDGKVFDPLEHPSFGLVEFKCPNVASYVDCKYICMQDGSPTLKTQHAYYWQVQGQLLTSGLEWCDFVVCAHEDIFVERIYRDPKVLSVIRQKGDWFYFYVYMQSFLGRT